MARQTTIVLTAAAVMMAVLGSPRAEYSMTDLVDAAKRGDGHAVHRLEQR